MRVLLQKERNSRWLNLAVVLILVAMIAIDLAIYFRPDRGSGEEEARVASAIERALKEQAKLAQQLSVEKEEAKANAARLLGKIDGLEKEADRKVGELARSLDRQKAELDRQTAEQTQWIARMAEQLDQTKRELAAANGRVRHLPRVGVRLVIPQADVQGLKDARAYLARSWAQLNKGATDLAMADAEEALRLDPTLAEAHLIRTEVFARRGKPEEARAERSEALATFCQRGIASIDKRDYEPGIADLERVIREAPDHLEAHVWCAKGYFFRSDYPNAIKEYTKAIALEPNNKQTYNDRGVVYSQVRDFAAAMSDLDHAIRLDPKFPEAYLNRGAVRLFAGDLAQAAADLSVAIGLDQRSAMAYRLRSVTYDRMGLAAKAADDRRLAESLGG